jgi:hypothetical protein
MADERSLRSVQSPCCSQPQHRASRACPLDSHLRDCRSLPCRKVSDHQSHTPSLQLLVATDAAPRRPPSYLRLARLKAAIESTLSDGSTWGHRAGDPRRHAVIRPSLWPPLGRPVLRPRQISTYRVVNLATLKRRIQRMETEGRHSWLEFVRAFQFSLVLPVKLYTCLCSSAHLP